MGLAGKDCYTQLAKYEDTGLMPEQIVELMQDYVVTGALLAEYQNAEEWGLLLRLPCKVNSEVYVINQHSSHPIEGTLVSYKSGEHYKKHYNTIMNIRINGYLSKIPAHYFGKTVFLTLKEAEAKLKEWEGN